MSSRMRIGLLLIMLAAFGWRVQGLANQSLWRDEVDAVWFATRHLPETLNMFIHPGQNGPLYFLALRPWFSLVGSSEFSLRYVSAMAGTLSVALLWQVARKISPPPLRRPENADSDECLDLADAETAQPITAMLVPFIASLFLALNPYQLWYSQEGKMYTVVVALVLAAIWFFWQGIAVGGWRPWLGFFITMTISLYVHLLLLLLYPFFFIWFLIALPVSKQHWRGYVAAMTGLILPYIPMVWWQWDLLMANQQMTGFSYTPLREMLRVLLFNHSRGFMPEPSLIWLSPLFFLMVVGVLLGMGEIGGRNTIPAHAGLYLAPWRRWAMLLSWLAAPIALIYLLSLRQPIFTDRYVIWLAPAAMILMALGVGVLWTNAGVIARTVAIVLIVYVCSFWLYAGWQQKTLPMKYDLRGGVTYLQEHRSPDELLLLQIPHLQYAVRYYTSNFEARPFNGADARLGWWAEGLWTNNGLTDDEARRLADQQMQQITAGTEDVWILRSEVEMWDGRHLMEEWLNAHGTQMDAADFHGVQVRQYVLDDR